MSTDWYLMNPSSIYTSGYENNEYNTYGQNAFDELLNQSPESFTVKVNGVDMVVIIQTTLEKYDNKRVMLSKIGSVNRGDIVTYQSNSWLVTHLIDDNKIHQSSNIHLCNSTFPIESDKTEVLIGYDDYGRPEYDYQILTKDEPCIVETKYYFNNRNEQITLPEDRVMISMKYQKATNIATNKEFDLYESRFRITFIDYSQVINGKGIMTITGERVMNK